MPLDKNYKPNEVEAKHYSTWEQSKSFACGLSLTDSESESLGDPYSIVIPPPNVTGSLHMGHALNLSLIHI